MHANQSAPVEIDAVIPEDRIVGWPGDGARSNDEAIDPLAFLQYAGAYNGLAMACLDVARRHALRRAHAQYGRRIADYATSQDAYGRALCEAQASRLFAYGLAKALDDATDGGDWTMYRSNPDAAPRAAFTSWGLEAKVLAAGLASRVSDAMLQLCGGRGYTRAAEIERLVRDAKAGWVMAPSNEVSQQIVGRWALLGADAVDWWNQKVDERALRNELGKLERRGEAADGGRALGRARRGRRLTQEDRWRRACRPDRTHVTYDPPVLGHLGMQPELVVRRTDGRARLGRDRTQRLVPAAVLRHEQRVARRGAARPPRRGALPAPPPVAGPRLRAQGQLALPRAFVDRRRRARTCSSRRARSTR